MSNAARRYRLLIVDDDVVDQRHYSRLLASQGSNTCEIAQVMDGKSGLASLATQAFDCVLLDFRLPDMSGLEFLMQAAPDGEIPCAVVLITGQGSEAIAVEAMKRGVQDYLIKDKLNASDLWRAVTQAVTQVELRRRLAESIRDLTAANLALEKEMAIRECAEAELRAAKDGAEQANQAKTRFVAMATHELRTPLNGILGYAQLLRIEAGLTGRQSQHVEAMIQAGKHLLEMIELVLDFASIETGRIELHPELMAVEELTARCIALIRPIADQRALSLRVLHAEDAPRQIIADPARFRQILLNLLGNAVKFTDTGGVELRVLAGDTEGGLRVEVADTGRGISDAGRDRLFHDFERLDVAASVEGTGLGLAIVARIVKQMGGTIDHRHNPAGGSVFWFDLPAAAVAASSPPAPMQLAASRPVRRILLVDDNAMNRDVVGAFLCAAGHSVVFAGCGADAIRHAADQCFDLVLMDVRMPGMDGLEATRRIRALSDRAGRIPIVALTADTFPQQVVACREAGMNGHIAKPVDYTTLIQAVDDATASIPPCLDVAPLPATAGVIRPRSRLDHAVLQRTPDGLQPDSIKSNLQLLRGLMLTMLDSLAHPDNLSQQVGTAHMLTSAAGRFGFTTLSRLAHTLDHALVQSTAEADALAQQMRAETQAALLELDAFMRQLEAEPARQMNASTMA